MKYLIKKSGLVIIGFSIVFMLGNCGGGGESENAEGTEGTVNKESTTYEDVEKSKETVSESYNLEEGSYYHFQANIQIPVITRYTEIYEKFGERTKDSEVEKETYIQLVISIENVMLDGNKFSGTTDYKASEGSSLHNESADINNENWNSWEGEKPHGTNATFYRCSGEFSEDGKMIKYIEIESLWFAHYGEKSGAYGIEKRRDFIIMKDIPVRHNYAQDINFKEFQFKHEPTIKVYGSNRFLKDAVEIISSITDADKIDYSAKKWLNMNREGKVTWDVWDEKEETLIKINQEYISRNKNNWPISFRRGEKIGDEEKAKETTKKVAIIVQQNEITYERISIMKGIGAQLDADFRKIPGLAVLERMAIEELKGEHDLSQSDLANPETAVRGDIMMTPDIEIILTQENRIPAEMDLMFESFTVRAKIRIVETGQIIDPNLVMNYDMKKTMSFMEDMSEFTEKVVAFTEKYLYN